MAARTYWCGLRRGGRAVLTRTWARAETHPRGCGQRRSGYRWDRRTRPASGASDWARGGEITRRPGSARSRGPTRLSQLRTGRASPDPANLEDVGRQRAPPRPRSDLGREVTCAPGPRCGCSQRSQGGGEKGRLLLKRSSQRDGWGLGDPGSAQPHTRRPPVTTARCGPSGASPPHTGQRSTAPQVRARFRVLRPRRPGVPAHPHVRHLPPIGARQQGPAPGSRPGRLEDRSKGQVPESWSGRRGAGLAHPAAPPQSRQTGLSRASQLPAGGAWAGQPPKLSGLGGAETEILETGDLEDFPKY